MIESRRKVRASADREPGGAVSGGFEQPLLTIADVARRFAVSSRTVRRLVADDRLKVIRIGRQLRFALDEIRRFESGSASQ